MDHGMQTNGQYNGDIIRGGGMKTSITEQMQGMSLGEFSDFNGIPVVDWSMDEVCGWLHSNGFGELEALFRSNDIKGAELLRLQSEDLSQLGISKIGVKKRIEDALAQLRSNNSSAYDMGGMGTTVKVFVGQIPKSASNDEVRELFEEFGHVMDCIVLRDKYTGESRGCGFVKFATRSEGEAAIEALHNNRTMAPSTALLQVQFAHGESNNDQSGQQEYKLFVGQLPKDITEEEVTELFGVFGELTEVCLLRHPDGNSKGCGFVKYLKKEAALRAIANLSGKRKLEGTTAPLNIEFAETKREKQLKRLGIPRSGGGLSIPIGNILPGGYGLIGGHVQPRVFPPAFQQLQQRGMTGVVGGGPQVFNGIPNRNFGQFPLGPQVAPGFLANGGGMFPADARTHARTGFLVNGGGMFPADARTHARTGFPANGGGMFPADARTHARTGFLANGGGMFPAGVGAFGVGAGAFPTGPPSTLQNGGGQRFGTSGKSFAKGPQNANIFVYNLPPEMGDWDLVQLFLSFGPILSTRVFIDKLTGRSKGFGFVSFGSVDSANAAVSQMNNFDIAGRKLKVQIKK